MRSPSFYLLLFAILIAGCSSDPDGSNGSSSESGEVSDSGSTGESREVIDSRSSGEAREVSDKGSSGDPEEVAGVPTVTGRVIRVEWVNLDPRREDPPLGLINRSSPELRQIYAKPSAWKHVKPIDDLTMANLLTAFKEYGYFKEAKEGRSVSSLRMGEGKGAVAVKNGDDHWALIFGPGMADTVIPELYRNAKHAVITLHSTTLWLAPRSPQDPNRTDRIPSNTRRPK